MNSNFFLCDGILIVVFVMLFIFFCFCFWDQLRKTKKKSSYKKKTRKREAAKKERLLNIDYLGFMSDEQIKKL